MISYSDKVYVYPTDTVWGLGAHYLSLEGQKKILKIKQLKKNRPFSLLFSSVEMLQRYIQPLDFMNQDWLENFFALESALALPQKHFRQKLPDWFNTDLVIVRVQNFPIISQIIEQCNGPISTTSLNITNQKEIVSKKDARDFINKSGEKLELIFDEKIEPSGFPSSIICFSENGEHKFLRQGRFSKELLQLFSF